MFVLVLVCSIACSVLSPSVSAAAVLDPNYAHGSAQSHTGVSPDGIVLFRFKREPEPQVNRAMTFTGFMPNGGMTAFSAAADSFQKVPQWYSQKPTDTLTPPAEGENVADQEEPAWTKKSKKKPYHPSKNFPTKNTEEEDEEEYEPPARRGNGGNAAASFNAWFPIMFGGFPNQYNRNSQDRNDPSYTGRNSEFPGQTVIANSVSNGKGGVASSHAVAYGSSPEGRNYGTEQPKSQGFQAMQGY